MSSRTYADAVDCLNSLQSNAATLEAVRASGGRSSAFAIPEMLEYLERIGYAPADLNALNVIHITGTKGKGSASAFTESILRRTKPDWKIGLYTSPHLVAVRERIRINGSPISESEFTRYFFEVWDRLQANQTRRLSETSLMPGYFRFLTLLAFHSFLRLGVNATVLEVGVGGTYDSTNIVPKPFVTGITALGIDHVNVLGRTITEIAWQKGGIFKKGVPAFTVQQPHDALEVLRQRAIELESSDFTVVPQVPGLSDLRLGLAGAHQIQNATLAVHLARSFLQSTGTDAQSDPLPASFIQGLQDTRWPGRCQTVVDPRNSNLTWYLDGAHTVESLTCCAEWFADLGVGLSRGTSSRTRRVLVFNCTSGRSGGAFLSTIYNVIVARLQIFGVSEAPENFFEHVIFCTNVTYADGHFKGDLTTMAIPERDLSTLRVQRELAEAWSTIVPNFPQTNIHVFPSIEHALREVHRLKDTTTDPVQVLTTGSLHLIGGIIEVAGLADVALE
ncbi:hypothetical protein AX16_001000 [Volvariella volvacea WC 439]|nr:hypothetical protein AX16_001000 [Volvariella volvacea WC 439]